MRASIDGLETPHPLGAMLPAIYQEQDLTMRFTRAFEDTCVWLARSAPKSPKSSTPISTLIRTANGDTATVRAMIVTCSTWFSNCW